MTPAVDLECYGLAEAKNNFSALTAKANKQRRPFVVLKGGRPWVEVKPLSPEVDPAPITITPVKREVRVADLEELFSGYDGGYVPREDGFAGACGLEEV
jgi:hypothetical protein